MEEMIQEKVAAKEAELHATYDERLRNYEERFVSMIISHPTARLIISNAVRKILVVK